MSDSLRDQLMGLGFKPAPVTEKPKGPRRQDGPGARGPAPGNRGAPGNKGAHAGKGARAPGEQGARSGRGGVPGEQGARSGRGGAPGEQGARNSRGGAPGKGGATDRGAAATGRSARGERASRPAGDIDLAKAYAIRAQREKDERIRAEQEKQEAARLRREARAKLATMLEGKALNLADAEHVRHFEYGGKIKRIHVSAEQLRALNAGELGVLQQDGRYLLVTAATLAEAEAIFPPAIALKVDPDAPAGDDPYADPKYQVPDDLIW